MRVLGLRGAAGLGMGSMLGAGVFAVWAPAAEAAGSLLLAAVAVAALVAVCNALSTAALAARHPSAGGVYAYGRAEVSPAAGYLAGLGFVIGKTASLAAMGLVIGAYAWPGREALVATVALVIAWLVNARGVTRTAFVASVLAGVVVTALAVFVVTAWTQPAADAVPAASGAGEWWQPLLQVGAGAGVVFFAFAGYARVATLGEEVREPERTIPRAVSLAIGAVLLVYVAVAAALMHRPGVAAVAASDVPVAELVRGTAIPVAAVSVVAVLAAFGAMVGLAAGVGRTAMAMAREDDLPRFMARQGATGVPWIAEGVVVLVAIGLAWWGNLTLALSMSAFSVCVYYAVANYAALKAFSRKGDPAPRRARWIARAGLVGCVALALSLPAGAAVFSIVLALVALAVRWLLGWLRRTRAALRRREG